MTALLAWLATLLSPFKKSLAVFGLIATVLGAVFLKGRSAGKAAEREKQEAAVKKWSNAGMRLIAPLLISTMLLAGCVTAPVPAAKCPALAAPPAAVIDALEASGRSDPKSAEWVVKLEKHYQKLDACGG